MRFWICLATRFTWRFIANDTCQYCFWGEEILSCQNYQRTSSHTIHIHEEEIQTFYGHWNISTRIQDADWECERIGSIITSFEQDECWREILLFQTKNKAIYSCRFYVSDYVMRTGRHGLEPSTTKVDYYWPVPLVCLLHIYGFNSKIWTTRVRSERILQNFITN